MKKVITFSIVLFVSAFGAKSYADTCLSPCYSVCGQLYEATHDINVFVQCLNYCHDTCGPPETSSSAGGEN